MRVDTLVERENALGKFALGDAVKALPVDFRLAVDPVDQMQQLAFQYWN